MLVKFFKHAGFVIVGYLVTGLGAFFTNDPALLAFVKSHPITAILTAAIPGLLGSLSQWLKDQDAAASA